MDGIVAEVVASLQVQVWLAFNKVWHQAFGEGQRGHYYMPSSLSGPEIA